MRNIFIIFITLFTIQNALCQSSFSLDFGGLIGNNGSIFGDTTFKIPSKDMNFRNGYILGLKGVFGTYGFFISPGIYFQSESIDRSFKIINPLVKSPSMKKLKAKSILGYKFDMFSDNFTFRVGGGVNWNYLISIDNNNYNYSFSTLKDQYLAYNFDLGFDFNFFNLSLSYEKSLKNVLIDNDKFDNLILTAGIDF